MPLDDTDDNGKGEAKRVTITRPKFERASVHIIGTAPYCQNKFSAKARAQIEETQREGSRSRKGRKKEARNFEDDWKAAQHISSEGWIGIPAPGFRNALIDSCRMAGFQMVRGKMSLFCEAEGVDFEDATPLIRILGNPEPPGKPMPVRNESGVVDLRCRPIWLQWEAIVPLRWDADQFSAADVVNLMARAGVQCGIGEGRPFSKNSNGIGWGTWEIKQ
jgi:hypothetical protein